MKKTLQLNYKKPADAVPGGAFIRGTTAYAWLLEIDSWGIAVDSLLCFPVPEGMGSLRPAGLFVVFGKEIPDAGKIAYPLRVVADTLFLPADAELEPEVTEEEIRSLLIWNWQLFHPSIGFVGFEKTDRVALADLLEYTPAAATSWDHARPGNPPGVRLQQISMQKLTPGEVLESLKGSVSSKPLEDLPQGQGDATGKGEGKASGITGLLDKLGRDAFTGAISGLQKLDKLFSRNPNAGSNPPPGLFSKLEKWFAEKRDHFEKRIPPDLEQKRDRELNRLLNLFDKNTDEALQYALPLDSPYFNRGLAAPSSRLWKRVPVFNLNFLGGGGRVDAWDAGNYYQELRNRYQQAAAKEIEQKDFKKAAYIYAHLLGDFSAAANVLQQGKHYREAAALYKDHLKNAVAAAECLEKGGLLLEAAEIWMERNQYEKAGDLYKRLDQRQQSDRLYEQCRDEALKSKNYLDAARILEQKLGKPDEAGQTLLEGWEVSNQAEACLNRYFDIVAARERKGLMYQVQQVFDRQTPKSKKAAFLNVLIYVNKTWPDKELENVVQDLAFGIVSEQAAMGNPSALNVLKNFIRDDRLLPSDCNRYLLAQKDKPKLKIASRNIRLEKGINWMNIISYDNQLLVTGTKENRLHLARINRDGHMEYHCWSQPVNEGQPLKMIADPFLTNLVLIRAGDEILVPGGELLEANHHFDKEVYIESGLWFPHQPLGIALCKKGVTLLRSVNSAVIMDLYSTKGSLLKSFCCSYGDDHSLVLPPSGPISTGLVYQDEYFYVGMDENLLRINEADGTVVSLSLHAPVRLLAANSRQHAFLRMVAGTDKGCVLVCVQEGLMFRYGDYFAREMEARHLAFIPNNYLVVAGVQRAAVYTFRDDTPVMRCLIETDAPIAGVVSTNIRGQCAILEETGMISIHDLDE